MISRLEFEFGGLAKAAQALRISRSVLSEVRKLSTTRGTGAEVRKFEASVTRTPLTAHERAWLSKALEAIVRRTGAIAAGAKTVDEIKVDTLRH